MTQAKHAIAATSGCGIGIMVYQRKPTPSCDTPAERIIGLCMAPQYSSLSIGAYMQQVEDARAACADETPIRFVTSWHRHPLLIAAIVEHIQRTLNTFPAGVREQVPVVFTAHSLPERVIAMKDPYPRRSMAPLKRSVRNSATARRGSPIKVRDARERPGWGHPLRRQWALADEGHRHVLVAPIGFLCDHVETLYDIDIELTGRPEPGELT